MKIMCKICGKEFTPKRRNHIYCSVRCRRKKDNLRRSPPLVEIECKVCGKIFKTHNKRRKTCSNECSQKNKFKIAKRHNERNKIPIPKTRICIECGKKFKPIHHSNTLCSNECKKKRMRRIQREWQRKHRRKSFKKQPKEDYSKYNEPLNPPKLYSCQRCGQLTPNRFFCHDCHKVMDRSISTEYGGDFIYGGYGKNLMTSLCI